MLELDFKSLFAHMQTCLMLLQWNGEDEIAKYQGVFQKWSVRVVAFKDEWFQESPVYDWFCVFLSTD